MENPDQLRELFRMQKSLNERICSKTKTSLERTVK
jgi:hypothetical protein